MEITNMFLVQAHTEYKSTEPFWLDFDEDSKFFVMGINKQLGYYFVTDNMYTPFTELANTGFVSMDYFWRLNYY
jgi:hypothetical protein